MLQHLCSMSAMRRVGGDVLKDVNHEQSLQCGTSELYLQFCAAVTDTIYCKMGAG